tara:strand:- start:1208 stop:1327 length:120 start_codon:yes stop_codon:yes gene_type:complete
MSDKFKLGLFFMILLIAMGVAGTMDYQLMCDQPNVVCED